MKPFTLEWWMYWQRFYLQRSIDLWQDFNICGSPYYADKADYYEQVSLWIQQRIIKKYGE